MSSLPVRSDGLLPEPSEGIVPAPMPPAGALQSYGVPLYRSRFIIAGFLLVGVIGGFLAGVIRPNEYTSVGKVLVRVGERERIQPDAIEDGAGGGGAQVLSNELHLLGNEAIYRRAAERVGPKRIIAPYDPTARYGARETSLHVALLHRLQTLYFRGKRPSHDCKGPDCGDCVFLAQQALLDPNRTQVAVAQRSNVIIVRHTSHDSTVAKEVVDALLAEFDLRHQEIYTARGAVQLLRRRLEELVGEAGVAEQELLRLREELGIHDLVIERQRLLDAQYALDQETAALALDIKLAERDLSRQETQLAELVPVDEPIREQRWEANPAYQKQQTVVEELIRRRAELLVTFTPDTRPVKNIDADIEREEAKLADIMPFVRVESFRPPGNEEYERLRQHVDDTRNSLSALHTRLTEKESARSAIAERLRTLRENEPRLSELSARTAILRKAAEDATATLASKRVLETLDEAQISNLVVLDWGSFPRKSGPDRFKILLTGTFAGLVAGVGAALLRGRLDARLHGPGDLELAAGAPVLAVIRRERRLVSARRKP